MLFKIVSKNEMPLTLMNPSIIPRNIATVDIAVHCSSLWTVADSSEYLDRSYLN
jgi:hypothetical protein